MRPLHLSVGDGHVGRMARTGAGHAAGGTGTGRRRWHSAIGAGPSASDAAARHRACRCAHTGSDRRGDHYRGEQGLLFGDELDAHPEDAGYRGPTACAAAGITYRQLDYWARTGLVEPSVRSAHGSGSQRLYGFRDILVLKVVKRLLDTGISLQQIRAAVQHLRDHGAVDLAQVTLDERRRQRLRVHLAG